MAENFKAAFASARKAGKKVFNWNGKSYNTKLAPDGAGPAPKARPAPVGPKARPSAGKAVAATATSPAVPPFPSGEKNPTKVANAIQKGNRAQRTQRTEARAARKAAASAEKSRAQVGDSKRFPTAKDRERQRVQDMHDNLNNVQGPAVRAREAAERKTAAAKASIAKRESDAKAKERRKAIFNKSNVTK